MEMVIDELIVTMREGGYEVVGVEIEAVDLLCAQIKIDSKIRKIYVYVYDDRFGLSGGFGVLDVLRRDEVSKHRALERKIWHCMACHFAKFIEDVREEKDVEFRGPCKSCKYNNDCDFDVASLLRSLEKKSSIESNWDLNHQVCDSDIFEIKPLMLGERPSRYKYCFGRTGE